MGVLPASDMLETMTGCDLLLLAPSNDTIALCCYVASYTNGNLVCTEDSGLSNGIRADGVTAKSVLTADGLIT